MDEEDVKKTWEQYQLNHGLEKKQSNTNNKSLPWVEIKSHYIPPVKSYKLSMNLIDLLQTFFKKGFESYKDTKNNPY